MLCHLPIPPSPTMLIDLHRKYKVQEPFVDETNAALRNNSTDQKNW